MPLPAPDVAMATITEYVRTVYGIEARDVTVLAAVSDADMSGYRIDADEGSYFLKLRGDAPPPPLARHLADIGVAGVLAPLKPRIPQQATCIGERTAILYPFIAGENAFRRPLREDQWTALGAIVRGVHDAPLPPTVTETMRRETYSDRWRVRARGYLAGAPPGRPDDAVAHDLLALLAANRTQIASLAEHAEQLAALLLRRSLPVAPCHGDLHAGNVLVDDAGSLTIVDWDDPVLAPKERDLMFVGAGIGGAWKAPAEWDAFFRGYGAVTVDAEALAYYRCERITEDVAVFCDSLLLEGGHQGADRRESLRRLANAFEPDNVVEIAERTFARL